MLIGTVSVAEKANLVDVAINRCLFAGAEIEDNDTENDTSDASKEDDGKLHSLEGTVKIEDLIPVTAASNIKIYVKAVSAQGYTFTYDLFDGIVNQDITDFETTADISGGDYTVTDPAGSKYEP